MVFGEYAGFRFEFWQGLLNVGSYALYEISTYGRLRLAYPFTEIAGGSATNLIESLLGLDPMLAYGLWRVLVVVGIGAVFIALVHLITAKASFPTRAWAIFLSGLAIPATAIGQDRLSGFRVFPSHYGLMAILGILFAAAVWWLFQNYSTSKDSRKQGLILFAVLAMGPVIVMSSEFFYAIGPAIVAGRLVQIYLTRSRKKGLIKQDLKSLAVFATGFFLSLVAVRAVLAYFCAQSSFCYSRTKVTLGVDSFLDGSFAFVGRLPFVPQIASLYSGEVEISDFTVPFVLFTAILTALYLFLRSFSKGISQDSTNSKEMMHFGLVLISLGTGWSFSTAFAVSSTEAYLRGPLGSAGSEAIQLAIGASLILVGTGLVLVYSALKVSRRLIFRSRTANVGAFLTGSVAILFLIVGAWGVNATSPANQTDVADIFMQRELSTRVITPDVAGNKSTDRCELVIGKMLAFPRFKEHEDTVLWGLNLRYQRNFGVDFCSYEVVSEALEESGLR
jgi:hypothetical protein